MRKKKWHQRMTGGSYRRWTWPELIEAVLGIASIAAVFVAYFYAMSAIGKAFN